MTAPVRRRLRAADVVSRRRPSLFGIAVLFIALLLVLVFKGAVGDRAANVLDTVAADPELELPSAAIAFADGGTNSVRAASDSRRDSGGVDSDREATEGASIDDAIRTDAGLASER